MSLSNPESHPGTIDMRRGVAGRVLRSTRRHFEVDEEYSENSKGPKKPRTIYKRALFRPDERPELPWTRDVCTSRFRSRITRVKGRYSADRSG